MRMVAREVREARELDAETHISIKDIASLYGGYVDQILGGSHKSLAENGADRERTHGARLEGGQKQEKGGSAEPAGKRDNGKKA